jgi:hypothetical protein
MHSPVHAPAGYIEQSMDDTELRVRCEYCIARPGSATPITQQVGGQYTGASAKMLHDR